MGGLHFTLLGSGSEWPKDFSRVILLRQIWIVKYLVKYSTVDCKYLLFLQDFFFRLKPKQYKKCQYCRLFKKKYLETHKAKQIIWRNKWCNIWRSICYRVKKFRFQCKISSFDKSIFSRSDTMKPKLSQLNWDSQQGRDLATLKTRVQQKKFNWANLILIL